MNVLQKINTNLMSLILIFICLLFFVTLTSNGVFIWFLAYIGVLSIEIISFVLLQILSAGILVLIFSYIFYSKITKHINMVNCKRQDVEKENTELKQVLNVAYKIF